MYGSAVILLATQLAVTWGLQGTVPLFLENGKLDPIADRSSRNVAVRARDSFDLTCDQCSAFCWASVGSVETLECQTSASTTTETVVTLLCSTTDSSRSAATTLPGASTRAAVTCGCRAPSVGVSPAKQRGDTLRRTTRQGFTALYILDPSSTGGTLSVA